MDLEAADALVEGKEPHSPDQEAMEVWDKVELVEAPPRAAGEEPAAEATMAEMAARRQAH